MKSWFKSVVVIAAMITLASLVYGQAYPYSTEQTGNSSPFFEGTMAGKADAKGSAAYGCGGFLCGVFGVVAAAVSDPQPDPVRVNYLLQSKGSDYVSAYTTSYTKESRKKNLTYAAIGWGASVVVSTIYYVAALSQLEEEDDDYYDKHPAPIGISIPLGKPAPAFSSGN